MNGSGRSSSAGVPTRAGFTPVQARMGEQDGEPLTDEGEVPNALIQ
jgi:hypothetical protein